MAGSHRSHFLGILATALVGALSYVGDRFISVCEYVIAKFDKLVECVVVEIVAEARAAQNAAKPFIAKVSQSVTNDCRGFVSLRKSLDASAV